MAASSVLLSLTDATSGLAFKLSADRIVSMEVSGADDTEITYVSNQRGVQLVVVTQVITDIAAAALTMTPITVDEVTVYIAVDRIISVLVSGTGANILMDVEGQSPRQFVCTESVSSIQSAVAALVAQVTGDFGGLGVANAWTGVQTWSTVNSYASATSITAFATGGQASAVALTKEYNEITVCATAGDSVKLVTASAGKRQVVKNNGAAAADVFPFLGDSIDAGSANAAIRLAVGETMVFYCIDGTVWESSLPGAGTVGNPSLPVGTTNKGFYQVSANQLGTSINGALVAVADASGMTADSLRNRVNLGTTPVGTVSIVEYGDGRDITTVLTLTNFIVGAPGAAAAAKAFGNIVYAFPAGQHVELVYSLSSLVLTAAGTAVATDTGLGSVVAVGAVNVLSGTATFENRLTGQTITTGAAGGAAVSALTTSTGGAFNTIAMNVAASVKNVFLNSAGDWNVDNSGNLLASGTIVLKWTLM